MKYLVRKVAKIEYSMFFDNSRVGGFVNIIYIKFQLTERIRENQKTIAYLEH